MTITDTDTARIPELEAWLDEHGVGWRLAPDLPIDSIDALAGLANQARSHPLDEETVDRYAADMAAGAIFPPVVVRALARKLVPVGGNHRIAAARKAGRTTLAAYVLPELSADVIHLLAIEDNRRHGLPLTDAERLYHAIQLVNGGRTTVDAAAICGIPTHKLGRQLDANRGAQRAIRLDVDEHFLPLSVTARQQLNRLTDDNHFRRVVPLAASGAIKAAELADTCSRLNTAGDGGEQLLAALELDAGERTRRGGGHPVSKSRAPAIRLLHDLDGICDYDARLVIADCRSTEVRAAVVNQIKAAARRLMEIQLGLTS